MQFVMYVLLQAAPGPPPPGGGGGGGGAASVFTNIFWLTIGFIFLSAIIGAVIARRRRDRCLKLLRNYHVTLVMTNGRVTWGDLDVFAQGIEVTFDTPHRSELGFIRSGYMMYEPEMGNLLALVRHVGDLPPHEQDKRRAQVEARFRPGLVRRTLRWIQNIFNTIRDAFTQTLGAVVGHVATAGKSTVIQTQRGQVERIGQTVLAAFGNAYEPMLERHIGRPVVLQLQVPGDPAKRMMDLPGYLAEYSDRFVALFNVEHEAHETISVPLDQPLDRDDLKIELAGGRVVVTNKALVPLVIQAMRTEGGEAQRMGMVLTTGATVRLPRLGAGGKQTLDMARMLRLDVVCPRAYGSIRFASVLEVPREEGKSAPK